MPTIDETELHTQILYTNLLKINGLGLLCADKESINHLTQCFLFMFLFYATSLPGTGDDGSQTLAENVSSDDATQCSQSEEDLDAQVER